MLRLTRKRSVVFAAIILFVAVAILTSWAWSAAATGGSVYALSLQPESGYYPQGCIVTISGTVWVNGLPAYGTAVSLQIDEPTGNPLAIAQGYTDPQGNFKFTWPMASTATYGIYPIRSGAMSARASSQFQILPGSYPTTKTMAAIAITPTSASLQGEINPQGQETECWFRFGETPSLNNRTATMTIDGGAPTQLAVSRLSGLAPSRTYFYQCIAQNLFGVTTGETLLFITADPAQITLYLPLSPGWNMISLPLILPSPDPQVVFAGLPTGWRLFSWDAANGRYLNENQTILTLGQGCWLQVAAAGAYPITGLPNSASSTLLPLSTGWNMIGSPYENPIAWNNVQVTDGTNAYSLNNAPAAWILKPAYYYGSGLYHPLTDGGAFQPLLGYWLKAKISGLNLIFPIP